MGVPEYPQFSSIEIDCIFHDSSTIQRVAPFILETSSWQEKKDKKGAQVVVLETPGTPTAYGVPERWDLMICYERLSMFINGYHVLFMGNRISWDM